MAFQASRCGTMRDYAIGTPGWAHQTRWSVTVSAGAYGILIDLAATQPAELCHDGTCLLKTQSRVTEYVNGDRRVHAAFLLIPRIVLFVRALRRQPFPPR